MQPSKYQAAILDWVANGEGHGACNAVAGAGKSTTLRLVAEALKAAKVSPSLVRVMVFGKSNAEDLKKKFDKTWGDSIATLHSTGWGLLKTHFRIRARQGKVTDAKPRYIGQDLGFLPNYRKRSAGSLIEAKVIKKGKDGEVLKLYNLLRLTNQATEAIANPTAAVEAVNRIIGHFDIQGIEDVEAVTEAVRSMLVEGVRRADQKLEFDFTDQIWLPVHLGLTPSQPYQFLLVDECQDLNAAQLELCFQLVAENGRMLFVGDRNQSIMGFSGADHRSFQTIVDRTQATELPLSICYRCPRDHIRLVKANFPKIPIEPAENADAGEICETFEAGLNGLLKDGDLVLGRKTAPLVSTCIQLIAGGVKAAVKGRDIGEQLKEEISTIAKVEGFQFDNFSDHLRTYRSEQVAYYRKRGGDVAEQLVEAVTDRCEAIEAIYTAQQSAKSTADLENYIDSLFSDAHQPVTLCTIHRAKGLEADRVFIIRPSDLPLTWKGQLSWQLEQEQNLLYVALTRSKQQLTIVKKGRNDDVPWFVDLDDDDEITTVNADSQPVAEEGEMEAIAPAAPPEAEAEAKPTAEADSGNTGGNVFNQVMQHLQELDDQIAEVDDEADEMDDEAEASELPTGRQWVSLGTIAMPVSPDNPKTYETQSRVAMDGSIVERYAEDMAQGRWEWERDPVILFAEAVPNGPVIYWVGDGHHRIAAANFAHLDMVFANVRIGTKRDAIFHSLTANRQHGLQRTNDDKRNAVRIALLDPEWTKMSDRAIAEHCGVSAPFVGKIRSELEESGQVEATTQRVSKSGKTLQTANIGTKPALSNGSHAATDEDWDDEPEDQGGDDDVEDGRRQDGSIDRRRASARNGSGERSNIIPLPTKDKGKADGGKAKSMPKETPEDVVRIANRYGNRKLIEWLSWEMPMDELVKLAAAIDGVLEGRVDSVAAGHSTEEW